MIGFHIKKFGGIYLGYNIMKILALKNHIMICYPLKDLDILYPILCRKWSKIHFLDNFHCTSTYVCITWVMTS